MTLRVKAESICVNKGMHGTMRRDSKSIEFYGDVLIDKYLYESGVPKIIDEGAKVFFGIDFEDENYELAPNGEPRIGWFEVFNGNNNLRGRIKLKPSDFQDVLSLSHLDLIISPVFSHKDDNCTVLDIEPIESANGVMLYVQRVSFENSISSPEADSGYQQSKDTQAIIDSLSKLELKVSALQSRLWGALGLGLIFMYMLRH